MELTSGILSRDKHVCEVGRVVEFLRTAGIRTILVAYGFYCDCPDEQLYQDIPMSVDHLPAFIAESESAGFYRLGKDNLHVKSSTGEVEFLFCHESDIHFITEEAELFERLKEAWLGAGCRIFEKRGGEWQPVPAGPPTNQQGAP